MNKNIKTNLVKEPANSKIIENAAKKLQKMEKSQKEAEKYFKEREYNEQKLKLIEANLKKKISQEKKFNAGLEEKTLEKMQNLLNLLSTMDQSLFEKVNVYKSEKNNQSIQTDKEETQSLREKLTAVEKENEKLCAKKSEYKKNLAVSKIEVENLKNYNDKMGKEVQMLQNSLEELAGQKNQAEVKYKEIERENKALKEKLAKFDQTIKDYSDLKSVMEENIKLATESNESEEKTKRKLIEYYKGNLELLAYFKILDKVAQYLPAKDLNSLKLTSKIIKSELETNSNCTKIYYMRIIGRYRRRLHELDSVDMKRDYHISDDELEKIMNDYLKNKKHPGRELRSAVEKAMGFMNKDVKGVLGIKLNTSHTPGTKPTTPGNNQQAGIMGGIGSLFGGLWSKSQTNTNEKPKSGVSSVNIINTPTGKSGNSGGSSRGMSIALSENPYEIEKQDKLIISNHIYEQLDLSDFDYSSPQDIKNILNNFLKSKTIPTEKLTSFIKEICSEYAEFFFYSTRTINDLRELEILKDALNERYKVYYKLSIQLKGELGDNGTRLNPLNQKLEKIDIHKAKSIKITDNIDLSTETRQLKEKIECYEKRLSIYKNKESLIATEYESFKQIFMKEINNLKYDLDDTIRQRNNLRNLLIEFKGFFNSITDPNLK